MRSSCATSGRGARTSGECSASSAPRRSTRWLTRSSRRSIRSPRPLNLPVGLPEHDFLQALSKIAGKNRVRKSYIGLGYYDTITPPVILRNVMENPGWYTPYTPYQAEIAQGRLESLLNFQTMVTDLTGMEVANASLLDEPTAAAEAMTLLHRVQPKRDAARNTFLVSSRTWPQTRAVIESRAEPLGIEVRVVDPRGHRVRRDGVRAVPAVSGRTRRGRAAGAR